MSRTGISGSAALIPRSWLAAGKEVRVERAPTLFGPVNFAICSRGDSMQVELDPPKIRPPRSIQIRLRHPDQQPITH